VGVLKSGAEVTFARPRADVFDAVVRALEELKMKIKSSDAATGHIEAVTRMSLASWGEKIHIDLVESEPGKTKATMSSANRAQLVSWGKNKRNLDEIVEATKARLGAGAVS
jgi:hypothetical protein